MFKEKLILPPVLLREPPQRVLQVLQVPQELQELQPQVRQASCLSKHPSGIYLHRCRKPYTYHSR